MTTLQPTPETSARVAGRPFPPGFRLGAATSAFQIEGSTHADGRTHSIWDTFCRVPGAVAGGDDGTVACDHYRRSSEDIALMRSLNLDTYRFSVAWPRIRPDGGAVNRRGLDFYSRLVDELLGAGISPWLTLYHWDLPQTLEDRGGWTSRDTSYRFAEYALSVHEALGDRVQAWTTLNEPWCSAFLGYAGGQHAPGRREPRAALQAVHHLLLGHGLAVTELRRRAPDLDLGITLNLSHVEPADPEQPGDRDAARRIDGLQNRIFTDPVLTGRYPADVLADTARFDWDDETVRPDDLTVIAAPLDVLGVNYYHGDAVSARDGRGRTGPWPPAGATYVGSEDVRFADRGLPVTGMGWEVQPWGLRDLLVRLHRDYPGLPPIHITENGAAYDDRVGPDGAVEDPERTAYLHRHLSAVLDAVDAGVDVRGYLAWSLLDNFEWAYGYAHRFGLVHVDYATQARVIKGSGRWYAGVAASRLLEPPE